MAKWRACCVPSCPMKLPQKDSTGPERRHRFPTDKTLCKRWLENLGMSPNEDISNKFVCSLHFPPQEFHSTTCKLLQSYNDYKGSTCSRSCHKIPHGLLPTKGPAPPMDPLALPHEILTSAPAPPIPIAPRETQTGPPSYLRVVPATLNEPMKLLLTPAPMSVLAVKQEMLDEEEPQPQPPLVFRSVLQPALGFSPGAPKPAPRLTFTTQTVAKEPVPPRAIAPKIGGPTNSASTSTRTYRIVLPAPPKTHRVLPEPKHEPEPVVTPVNVCRMCAEERPDLVPIFDSDGSKMAKKINQCLPFQVHLTDTMSLFICNDCTESVEQTHRFYMQCKEANAKLRCLERARRAEQGEQYCLPEKNQAPVLVQNKVRRTFTPTVPILLRKRPPAPAPDPPTTKMAKADCEDPLKDSNFQVQTQPATSWKEKTLKSYPAVPPGTKTYSIYKFPDPKNLSRLPDFDCLHCPDSFYNIVSWTRHMYTAHSKFLCPKTDCHQEFNTRAESEAHQVTVHDLIPTLHHFHFEDFGDKECTFCHAEFNSLKTLRSHVNGKMCSVACSMLSDSARHSGKTYTCHFCNKTFLSRLRARFILHIMQHLGHKSYACHLCDKSFVLPVQLQRHIQIHTDVLAAQCEVCGASFKNKRYLQQHMLKHSGRWNNKCMCCPATFRTTKGAEAHFKTHSQHQRAAVGNKPYEKMDPYECSTCGKHYKILQYYNEHLEKHDETSNRFIGTKVRNNLCSFCGKCFKLKTNLRQHMERMHSPREAFECDICKRVMKGKSSLALHVKSHMVQLVKCELCDMQFRGEQRVRLHMRRVHVEKRFCCEFCGKAFKMKKHLIVHVRVHTNERPYSCKFCDLTFKQYADRSKHEAAHLKNKL